MPFDKDQVELDIKLLKANAYDVLATIEFLNAQYQKQLKDLQIQLQEINQQISSKDQVLKKLLSDEKSELEKDKK